MSGPFIALRVDGNRHIGLGHVFRNLFLADYLRAAGARVEFLMLASSQGAVVRSFFAERKIAVRTVSRQDDSWRADPGVLEGLYASGRYDAVSVDLLVPDPGDEDLLANAEYVPADVGAELALVAASGLPACVFSDAFDPMTFNAGVVVNTCPEQRGEWYASAEGTTHLLGPQGYILAPEFRARAAEPKSFSGDGPRKVVVFCGGNDHRGFTPVILDGIEAAATPMTVEAVLGAATPDGERKAEELAARVDTVHFRAPDLAPILAGADFVFSTSGNTLFDLAALGVPCAAVSTRERQRVTARFFEQSGSCIDLGCDPDAIPAAVSAVCREVVSDQQRLATMSAAGHRTVDGKGGERIAGALLDLVGGDG